MKKIIIATLALVLVFSLVACGKEPEAETTAPSADGAIPSIHELVVMEDDEVNKILVGHTKDELTAAWGEPFMEENSYIQWDAHYELENGGTRPYGGVDANVDENNVITQASKYKISGSYSAGVEWYQNQKDNKGK